MQATSTIFFHGGSTVGCDGIADGFSGDALWKITSLYGGVEEDSDGDDAGGGFLSPSAWRFFSLWVSSGVGCFCSFSGGSPVRYVYRLDAKPGWFVPTTCFGGFAPLLGTSSSGVLGFLAIHGASDSIRFGDAMTIGHLWKPGRSASTKHVIDVLLKTAFKNSSSSPRRWSAPGSGFRLPEAKKTGRCLQGPECNFCFYQECLCKMGCNHQNYQ